MGRIVKSHWMKGRLRFSALAIADFSMATPTLAGLDYQRDAVRCSASTFVERRTGGRLEIKPYNITVVLLLPVLQTKALEICARELTQAQEKMFNYGVLHFFENVIDNSFSRSGNAVLTSKHYFLYGGA